ncbi:sulfotransferase, partial [Desulfobacter sp.]|uniref:tetratricopeptide repeat-containing sulfotransferase family protein n=1 Tax=Desulfobacter sp. TaxID=2294 RepID=UPI003D14FAF5
MHSFSPVQMDIIYKLWKALLTHGRDGAEKYCKQQTGSGLPEELTGLITMMQNRRALHRFLMQTAAQEKSMQGWHALFRGIARLALGDREQAEILFKAASGTEACRAPSFVYLGNIYLLQNETDLAWETLREGISLDRTIGEFHLIAARLHLAVEAFDKAQDERAIAVEKGGYSRLGLKSLDMEEMMARNRFDQAAAAAANLLRDGLAGASLEEIAFVGLRVLMLCGAFDEADRFLDQALEKDPENIILLIYRADIAVLRGRYLAAGQAVSQALAIAGENISLLVRKAQLTGKAFSPAQGLGALDRIVEKMQNKPRPNLAVYQAMYGDIHFELDNVKAAVKAYEAALQTDAKCVPALAGLANVMMVEGKLDRARELQDLLYKLTPVRAMQAMINNERMPGDDRNIQRMAAMAKKPGTPLQMRASLNLSLARIYQKQEHVDLSMDYADKANALFRKCLSFDPEKGARQADRIISRMTREFFDSRQGFGTASSLPLFILGMPRSGTTLVEQILGSHSAVFPGGELGQMPRMWRRLQVWEQRMGSDFQKIPDCILELNQSQSVAFARKVEEEYREFMPQDPGKIHITDKLPHNFTNIGLIKLLFPKAKIIYCRRHAGAIAISNYFVSYKAMHGGMGFASDLAWIGTEIGNCRRLMAHWKAIFGDSIHVVDYEQLVAEPESVIKSMLDYLGLQWEEGVLAFDRLERPVKTASLAQVRKPLYKGSRDRWRRYEHRLRPMFEALDRRLADPVPAPVPLPPHEPSLFLRGMDLLKAGQNPEAEALFREILDIYPRHAAAMHMLGAAYSNQGKILPAHQCMKRSIQLHPGNHTWYGNLAIILDHMRRPEEAAE